MINSLGLSDPFYFVADAYYATRKIIGGLLANGKQNSEELLEMVYEVLADRYEFSGVITKNKGNASRPCPEDLLDELAERCDVVVTSTGD